jgi:phosphoenolpyruvate carboxykinase (GTP)
MASEITAAQYGAQGVVRRDPMAMLPFCGYNMADYFRHWIEMGKKMKNAPKIFHVNWFKTDENGQFLWPGFGDNLRILEWIVDRSNGNIGADESPIGYLPNKKDLDLTGLDLGNDVIEKLLDVSYAEWEKEVKDIREFYNKFGDKLPVELENELNNLIKRLKK